MKKSILYGLLTVLICLDASAASTKDSIELALSARHFSGNTAELEAAAGGADALIPILLELRAGSKRPFVSIRAERLLVKYSDRSEVQAALIEDMHSPTAVGLGRVIALQIDKAPSSAARQALSRAALSRSSREPAFRVYTETLKNSADSNVRKLASE